MSLYNKIIDRQKLKAAWSHVKANKPAAGVDGVTYEEFDAALTENLAQLNTELVNHSYVSLPVKTVFLYKGEKRRAVSLFSMRDKVVQQSIAQELVRISDGLLSPCVYAYRPGRSALDAVNKLETEFKNPENAWVLKTDIKDFFDTVDLKNLYAFLKPLVREEDVMELVKTCCEARELEKDGTLKEKRLGIYQGSGIAPVLSNIYLKEFDREVEQRAAVYVRYSDDMLILGHNGGELEELRDFMRIRLEALGLSLNEAKTFVTEAKEGVDFLGYRLSSAGGQIPEKAEKGLIERFEKVWLASGSTRDKLKKGAEILNGWEQYYRGERKAGSMEEYATVVYMTDNKPQEVRDAVKAMRRDYVNTYPGICRYLVKVWGDDSAAVLYEYEQYYMLEGVDPPVAEGGEGPFCDLFAQVLTHETGEIWSDLMQLYADSGAYNKASVIMKRIQEIDDRQEVSYALQESAAATGADEEFKVDDRFVQAFIQTFAGREDTYGREEIGVSRKRCVVQAAEPLTEEVVRAHLSGEYTVSTYVQRTNASVRFLVIDMDLSKKCFIEEEAKEALENHLPEVTQAALDMLKLLKRLGLNGYPEFSGFRGYHIWVFFDEWIPTHYVNMLTDIIDAQRGEVNPHVTVEYFPNKAKLKNGRPGQCVKLPYGIHVRSGNRSMLLDDHFRSVLPDDRTLREMVQTPRRTVKRIIGMYSEDEAAGEKKETEVDRDITGFGELPDSVRVVLEHCNLMRYLCQKARKTGYLGHFERLTVLYVFGHLGEEGKQFVHTVMEFTLNYKFHVTDKFISRLPEKPVSCLKLRDQYRQITAEFGCSCNFRRTPNCYPSPVLHAIKTSGDLPGDITLPTSRSISKAKEQQVVGELNIHKKVEELAGRIVEMKKQKRGIDKNIRKIEKELEKIYDSAGVDALEVSMGVMVRRKKEDGYEWLIEI